MGYLECAATTGTGTTSKGFFVVLAKVAPVPVYAARYDGVEGVLTALKIDEIFFAEVRPCPAGIGAAGSEGVKLLARGVLLQARFGLEHFNDLENGVGPKGVFLVVHAETTRTAVVV